jgi:hypothetical protein
MPEHLFTCPCGHHVHGWGYCGGGCGRNWNQGKALQMGLIEAEAFGGGYAGPGLGVDIGDGDLVENLGDGLGVDLATGDLELEIAPGVDVDLDRGGDPFGW